MKKYIFYSAAVLAFVSCANEVLIDDAKEDALQKEIKFETFSNLVTKAETAENSGASFAWEFFNHHTTFKVYGYKNTSDTKVFDGDVVTVDVKTPAVLYSAEDEAADPLHIAGTVKTPAVYSYTYAPARFWDKAATSYEFYAAAPENAGWTLKPNTTSQADDYFEVSGSVSGANIASTTPTTTYAQSFKGSGDVDLMIANPCKVTSTAIQNGETVQLHFNHILSRLNVTLKKDAVLADYEVKLVNLQVEGLISKGYFVESAPNAAGTVSRWTPNTDDSYVTYSAPAYTITQKADYVIESLVIPQNAAFKSLKLDGSDKDATPYLVLEYTIRDASNDNVDGKTPYSAETFVAYYNLAAAFGKKTGEVLAFNEGWQNTLNITLKPNKIEFCADVATWADATPAGTVTVY